MRAVLDIVIYALDLYKLVIVAGAVDTWQTAWKRKFAARDFRQDAPGIAPENRRTAY